MKSESCSRHVMQSGPNAIPYNVFKLNVLVRVVIYEKGDDNVIIIRR